MKSKFLTTVCCGIISSIVKDIISFIIRPLIKITFWDYAGVIIFGALPHGLSENILAIFVEVGFGIIISFVVVYSAASFDYQNHLVTYPLVAVLIWFIVRIGVVAF